MPQYNLIKAAFDDTGKKSYYVDGHEREDVVRYRNEFCQRYLTEYEPRCLLWIQISVVDAVGIEREAAKVFEKLNFTFAYKYDDPITGEKMLEFHVDYCRTFGALDGKEAKASVRAPPGQDECIFTQFLLGQRTWVGPKGERPLLPETEGEGYMLSAFQGRFIGFGRHMTPEELE
jgi:hypothetical protein